MTAITVKTKPGGIFVFERFSSEIFESGSFRTSGHYLTGESVIRPSDIYCHILFTPIGFNFKLFSGLPEAGVIVACNWKIRRTDNLLNGNWEVSVLFTKRVHLIHFF